MCKKHSPTTFRTEWSASDRGSTYPHTKAEPWWCSPGNTAEGRHWRFVERAPHDNKLRSIAMLPCTHITSKLKNGKNPTRASREWHALPINDDYARVALDVTETRHRNFNTRLRAFRLWRSSYEQRRYFSWESKKMVVVSCGRPNNWSTYSCWSSDANMHYVFSSSLFYVQWYIFNLQAWILSVPAGECVFGVETMCYRWLSLKPIFSVSEVLILKIRAIFKNLDAWCHRLWTLTRFCKSTSCADVVANKFPGRRDMVSRRMVQH